jgi:hypothetical protein
LLDLFTATPDRLSPIRGEAIHTVIEDGQGGWFIVCDFEQVGALMRSNLVHVLSDNRVDPDFNPAPNGPVHAIVLDGDTLFVGGEFTAVAGQSRTRLAAFDRAQNALLGWNPAANATVYTLAVDTEVVYVGGAFTEINGQSRRKIAALQRSNGTPTVESDFVRRCA